MSRLMNMLPFLYKNSKYIKDIQDSLESERNVLEKEIIDLYDNLFVESSSWSLEWWEKFLDVRSVSGDIDTRKSVIKNKLKFRGVTNKDVILELCSQYGFGQIEISEDFGNGKFTIRFISKEGEPKNLRDLINQLNLIIPSHISYDFHFTYVNWDEIKDNTWADVSDMTWESIKKLDYKKDSLIAIPGDNTVPGEIYPGQGL
ncbi:MAG: putative phage tail protein [Clostridia bacterium]